MFATKYASKLFSGLDLTDCFSSFGILAACVLTAGSLYRKLLNTRNATDTVVEAYIDIKSTLINDCSFTIKAELKLGSGSKPVTHNPLR